jgi:RNA polymerase sigma-70 factor (ECF subfamily)
MNTEYLFKQQTGEDFSKFYEEYNPKLISFINNICKDKDMAQDIATSSYITAFDNILSYDKEIAKFSTWLFTIAKNKTIREINLNKRTVYQDIITEDSVIIEDIQDTEDITDKEKVDIILEQINNLPYPYKEVMELFIVKKAKYADISLLLDKNINTIKTWIRKGKQILKQKSEEEIKKKEKLNGISKYT